MKWVVMAIRLLFGAWFVMSGLRYVQPGMPMGRDPIAQQLLGALLDSDILAIVKLIEFAVGAMLIANVYVPLALVVGFPVTLMVAYVCLILEFPAQRPLIGGGATLAAHAFLLIAYIGHYRPILAFKGRTLWDKPKPE
jgi:hypothetical protein